MAHIVKVIVTGACVVGGFIVGGSFGALIGIVAAELVKGGPKK